MMKKKLIPILGGISVLTALTGLGGYLWLKSKLPVKEERLSYLKEEMIAKIDHQLEGIDLYRVRSKRDLMSQKSLEELQDALDKGQISHVDLVAHYLLNIREYDQSLYGNNAVSEINSKAIEEAKAYDKLIDLKLPLKGIPILVKENINTNDMPTSAGSYALKDFIPAENAPLIDQLKSNGVIILGKTNLSELSYWLSHKAPSGYSAKKGQTHNPFGQLSLTPSGSSSGSAVAMATDLATLSLGTETVGSIVSPASDNSVVGYKPSHNKINGEGVIPITLAMDTVGPITKTVKDALATYNAASQHPLSLQFDKDYLKGKHVGLMSSSSKAFDKKLAKTFRKLGPKVTVVTPDLSKLAIDFVLYNDFEKDFNNYLTRYQVPVSSLEELIAFNEEDADRRIRYGQSYLTESFHFERDDKKATSVIKEAKAIVSATLKEYQLDLIVAKDNEGASLAATAGAPEVAVPFGKLGKKPVGVTFITDVNQDDIALLAAYSFEQATLARLIP